MNNITLIGRLGNEPELRFSQSGKAVVRFNVADTTGVDDKKKTIWHTVVAFDQMAEAVAENLHKGSRVIVNGRLNKATFEGRDGNKKEIVELVANDIGPSLKFGLKGETHNKSALTHSAESLDIQGSFENEEEPF